MDGLLERNRLLNLFDADELDIIRPHLVRTELKLRQVIAEPGDEITQVYFPESGLGSVIAVAGPTEIEVAHFGREAVTGLELLHGVDRSSHRVLIQITGEGFRIPRDVYLKVLEQCPGARALLARYCEAFIIQVEQTALVNGTFTIEQRLARWLLMCHDRLETAELPITHEFLSLMLGVRRAGVTTALHLLEGNHAIRSSRGVVLVRDRALLERTAGDSYGLPEAAYERLVVGASANRSTSAEETHAPLH